jgi:hypothetical protein
MGITLEIIEGPNYTRDDQDWEHNAYIVRLKRAGRVLTTDWMQGLGIAHDPQPEDVLASLMLDASAYENARDFSDFAADFGYDEDSRKAERIYAACGVTARKLRQFLGADWDESSTEDAEDAARRLVAA